MRIQLMLVALIGSMLPSRAEAPVIDEYQVKAAFLFNFAKFVEWPAAAFKNVDEPIGICLFGQSLFGPSLEDAVRGKTVGTRTFVLRAVTNAQEASRCHILFVCVSERKRMRALLEELKGYSILTVGETEDFTVNGGIIAFQVKDARVRIEIDASRADQAKLRISSKLLSLAQTTRKQ